MSTQLTTEEGLARLEDALFHTIAHDCDRNLDRLTRSISASGQGAEMQDFAIAIQDERAELLPSP